MSKSPSFLTNAATAARVLAISRRQFDRLVKARVIPRHGLRQFDLAVVVPAFVRYLRDGREGSGDLAHEKLLLTVAQRHALEQTTAQRARHLVALEDVSRTFDAAMVIVASQLEGLPGRACGEVAVLDDPAQCRKVLQHECRRIRSAAADALEAFARGDAGRGAAATTTDEDAA